MKSIQFSNSSARTLGGTILLCSAILALGACTLSSNEEATSAAPVRETPLVFTTFYPTSYLVERIAGDLIDLRCDVPSDADALFWTPTDDQIITYQGADLIVLNGAGMERWVEHVSLPMSRVVDSSRSFRDSLLNFASTSHSHGGGADHTHEGTDPHVWLDPVNVELQALAIHAALQRLLPEKQQELQANMKALSAELQEIHASYKALGPGVEGEWLYASHPAYNYLAARYGWRIVNFDLDPEGALSESQKGSLRASLTEKSARFMLWESAATEATIAWLREETQLTSLVVSPCELMSAEDRSAGRNFRQALVDNGEALKTALSKP